MYNLQLSAEQIEIRDTVRDFASKELKPAAIKSARMEALDHSPMWELIDKASQMGLRSLRLSEDLGGAGADVLQGGGGTDTADYSASASGVTVYLDGSSSAGGDAAGDFGWGR